MWNQGKFKLLHTIPWLSNLIFANKLVSLWTLSFALTEFAVSLLMESLATKQWYQRCVCVLSVVKYCVRIWRICVQIVRSDELIPSPWFCHRNQLFRFCPAQCLSFCLLVKSAMIPLQSVTGNSTRYEEKCKIFSNKRTSLYMFVHLYLVLHRAEVLDFSHITWIRRL